MVGPDRTRQCNMAHALCVLDSLG